MSNDEQHNHDQHEATTPQRSDNEIERQAERSGEPPVEDEIERQVQRGEAEREDAIEDSD